MRVVSFMIALVAISHSIKAQQDPQFSQNMYNHMNVNPAFAGERGGWVVSGVYRNQWQRMPDAPETYVINVDVPLALGRTEGGVGLNIMTDRLGMQTNLHLMANYAYKRKYDFGVLSAGIKWGVVNSRIEGELKPPTEENDPALGAENLDISKIMFDAGIGLFLSGERYYAGLALSHLTCPEMTIGQTGRFFWNRHFYATGGYTFRLTPKVDVQPSFFVKTDFISFQASGNAHFVYDKKYWAGLSYRYEEALIFMGGIELKEGLLLGYSYDWNVSSVGQYTGGSHEVTFSYSFGLKVDKREKIYKSVRFL